MATLKSTLKIESTDIFPTPVNFTQINNNTVAGDFSGFNTIDVNSTATKLNFLGAIGVTGAYVYLEAKTTNSHPVYVGLTATGLTTATAAIKLYPGDVAFFPAGNNAACDLGSICATSQTGTISYFIGEKAV
jgi:hypothetical protein